MSERPSFSKDCNNWMIQNSDLLEKNIRNFLEKPDLYHSDKANCQKEIEILLLGTKFINWICVV